MISTISHKQMKKIIENDINNYIIVDLRNKKGYNNYHVESAKNIEYEAFMKIEDYSFLTAKGKDIILYCSGGGRSIYATERLKRYIDYYNINIKAYSLDGGIS